MFQDLLLADGFQIRYFEFRNQSAQLFLVGWSLVWVRQGQETIERITGMQVTEMDFTDDRLTHLLRRLSKPETWQAIESELGRSILRVYELQPERMRLRSPGITPVEEKRCSRMDTAKTILAWRKSR